MKLWKKDNTSTSQLIETFTVGQDRDFDLLLAKFDVEGSIAHVTMLGEQGLMDQSDVDKAISGLQKIHENSGLAASLIVKDFIRIGNYVFFHTNHHTLKFYRQCDDQSIIIYKTTNKLSKITYKNNYLIFIDNGEFKIIDLETNTVDCFFIWKSKIDGYNQILNDFCIL